MTWGATTRLKSSMEMAENNLGEEATTVETRSKKQPTPEGFITSWPLYSLAPFENFFAPSSVSLHCDSGKCDKETTWLRVGNTQFVSQEGVSGRGFTWVLYLCGFCNQNYMLAMYRDAAWVQRVVGHTGVSLSQNTSSSHPIKKMVVTKIQKIGQYPALSVAIPKELEKNLGKEAISLYKKALINRNEGYGLGALIYIRRVVEDKTNDLIEVAAQLAESHSVDAAIVRKIRAAATERTTYDNKLQLASTVLPDALLIDGINPLLELYSLVSEGVHGLSEEQCVAVADETASVFEYIFTNLRAQTQARKGFVEKVKKWAGRGKVAEDQSRKEEEGKTTADSDSGFSDEPQRNPRTPTQ